MMINMTVIVGDMEGLLLHLSVFPREAGRQSGFDRSVGDSPDHCREYDFGAPSRHAIFPGQLGQSAHASCDRWWLGMKVFRILPKARAVRDGLHT
jgi:hypothetical protein